MAGRLDGKVALITGAARGQGEAEARLFAQEGAKVVLADVRDDLGAKAAEAIGDTARYVHLDVTSESDWEQAVTETVSVFGRLDVLVNNAGVVRFGPLAATTLEEYMLVVNVNQVGVFLGMRAAIAPMGEAGGGSIVNVSSVDGLHGMPFVVAYVASKFAVRGMTKTAAIELAPLGIRANSIHPGGIDTPMVSPDELPGADAGGFMSSRTPMGRLGTAEEVAAMALFLASDESSYCTGAEFVIDGGFSAGTSIPPRSS